MSDKQIYLIEVWRSPDGEHWVAECTTKDQCKFSSWWYAKNHYSQENWPYWFGLDGKRAGAIVVSREAFTRQEAIEISSLIISGKGLKRWSIDLNQI